MTHSNDELNVQCSNRQRKRSLQVCGKNFMFGFNLCHMCSSRWPFSSCYVLGLDMIDCLLKHDLSVFNQAMDLRTFLFSCHYFSFGLCVCVFICTIIYFKEVELFELTWVITRLNCRSFIWFYVYHINHIKLMFIILNMLTNTM